MLEQDSKPADSAAQAASSPSRKSNMRSRMGRGRSPEVKEVSTVRLGAVEDLSSAKESLSGVRRESAPAAVVVEVPSAPVEVAAPVAQAEAPAAEHACCCCSGEKTEATKAESCCSAPSVEAASAEAPAETSAPAEAPKAPAARQDDRPRRREDRPRREFDNNRQRNDDRPRRKSYGESASDREELARGQMPVSETRHVTQTWTPSDVDASEKRDLAKHDGFLARLWKSILGLFGAKNASAENRARGERGDFRKRGKRGGRRRRGGHHGHHQGHHHGENRGGEQRNHAPKQGE